MLLSRTIIGSACSALVAASVAAGQRRTPAAPGETKVGVTIAMQVAGAPYQFTGQARCTYAPKGYIYGTAAQQWSVEHSDGSNSVGLTLWKPSSGATDMFTLTASADGKRHVVTTSRGINGGTVQGSGEVKLTPATMGGTFTIDATTASGSTITGTIKCDAFTALFAEGGD